MSSKEAEEGGIYAVEAVEISSESEPEDIDSDAEID